MTSFASKRWRVLSWVLGPRSVWSFSVPGALILVVVAIMVAFVMTRTIRDYVNDTNLAEARRSAEFDASVLARHATPELFTAPAGSASTELDDIVTNYVLHAGIIRVKIWNPKGEVLYSDEPSLVGLTFAIEDDLAEALAGETVAEFHGHDKEENVAERQYSSLLSTYVPLRFDGYDNIVAVFEAYQDYGPIAARTSTLEHGLNLRVGGVLALLYIALLLTYRFSVGIIGRQQLTLVLQRQALKSQEHEQAKLASLADSMSAGLVMISAGGGVSYCNNQVGELLNCEASRILGGSEEELQAAIAKYAADPQKTSAAYRDLSSSDDAWRTINLVLQSPSKKVLRCSMFPVRDASGRDLGKGLLLSDITREFEVEQMKDEFIGIASHELRTPLTGIMGFTELLRDGLDPDSPEREWAGRVNEEARRLSALVSNLLDVSRIDSGTLELNVEPFNLQDCLADVVERALAGRPGRDVRVNADGSVELNADEAKVIQVLTNLIDNALKYSPDSEPVEVSYMVRGDELELSVTDHGAGIPRDQREQIFEKFHRLEATDPSLRGTGLGLYITRQLVNRMGGNISVRSKEGGGSTFLLSLPLIQPLAQAVAA